MQSLMPIAPMNNNIFASPIMPNNTYTDNSIKSLSETRANTDGNTGARKTIMDLELNNINSAVNKIIGDDPPALAEKEEIAVTSKVGQTSVMFELMSKIVQIEQLLLSTVKIQPGSTPRNTLAQIITQVAPQPFLRAHRTIQFNYNQWGANGHLATMQNKSDDTNSWTNILAATRTVVTSQPRAVPYLGNVTWSQLAPLINNTSIGEFSSIFRLKIRANDMDVMANQMAQSYNQIQAAAGYSAATKLAKLMAYQVALFQITRNEETAIWGNGQVMTLNQYDGNVGGLLGNRFFPLNTTNAALAVGLQRMTLGVVGYSQFVDLQLGRIPWEPNQVYNCKSWGTATAVVMCRLAELSSGLQLYARAMGELDFPLKFIGRNCVTLNVTAAGGLSKPGNTTWTPWISLSHIAGPTDKVLLVITDYESPIANAGALRVEFGNVPTDTVACGYPNVVTNTWALWTGPNNIYSQYGNAITTEIKNWEDVFGCASDRSTAMRWVAENSLAFGPPENRLLDGNKAITLRPFIGDAADSVMISLLDPGTVNLNSETIGLCRTPSGILRQTLDAPNNDPFSVLGLSTLIPCYELPAGDPGIDFLCYRSWLRPAEEYPQMRLFDPMTVTLAINELADALTAAVDFAMELHSVNFAQLWYSNNRYAGPYGPPMQLHKSNVVLRVIQDIFRMGIQYPGMRWKAEAFDTILDRQFQDYVDAYITPTFNIDLATGQGITDKWISNRKMPWNAISKFSTFFRVDDPNFAFWSFGTKKIFQNYLALNYVMNKPGDLNRNKYLAKLSGTVLNDNTGDNSSEIALWKEKSAQSIRAACPVTTFNTYFQIGATATALGFAYTQPTYNWILPMFTLFPTRWVADGGDFTSIVMTGNRDAFVRGTGTQEIRILTTLDNSESLNGADNFNDWDVTLFNPASLSETINFLG